MMLTCPRSAMKMFDGLDVAMHDAFRMRGIECIGNLDSWLKNLFEFQRLGSNALAQSPALQVVHDQKVSRLISDSRGRLILSVRHGQEAVYGQVSEAWPLITAYIS